MTGMITVIVVCLAAVLLSVKSEVITFQNGRDLLTNKLALRSYGETKETEITTQYIDSWNNFNGMTYFHGQSSYYIAESSTQYRQLIRFDGIRDFLPASSTVLEAEMTLTFVNYNAPSVVDVCFITKHWDHTNVKSYKSTGWKFNRWNSTTSKSESWTEPGGWADCDSRVTMRVNVPMNGASGNVTRSIQLDAGIVQSWIDNNSTNHGVLLKASSAVGIIGSSSNVLWQRPALQIKYSVTGDQPPVVNYPTDVKQIVRVIEVSADTGDDINGLGTKSYPLRSLARAVADAWPGDIIQLQSGMYAGGVNIVRPRITVQSTPGHWAVISAPTNDPVGTANVITLRSTSDGGMLRNLEISGGFYYGLMFWTDWGNYYTVADNVNKADAVANYILDNIRIHHTGSSCMKMVMKVRNVTVKGCEFHHCGHRMRTYGHGVEGVQAHQITVEDSYIHDVPGAGIHLVGGSSGAVLQRNFIANTGVGMNIGFITELEYFDTINNPKMYENINSIVVNNIITRTLQSGVNIWGANNVIVAFNTLFHTQEMAQDAILINARRNVYQTPDISSRDIYLLANIMTRSASARAGAIVSIREQGLQVNSSFVSRYNVYHDVKGVAGPIWQWGRGIMFEDDRFDFYGNISMWRQHCTRKLGYSNESCDAGSIEANPQLSIAFRVSSCSAAKDYVPKQLLNDIDTFIPVSLRMKLKSALTVDHHNYVRDWTVNQNVGAIAISAENTTELLSDVLNPVPAGLQSKTSPCHGTACRGLNKIYYDTWVWPFQYWLKRSCVDIIVDTIVGDDNQAFNYESNYPKPYKTISKALTNINQCDRILLRGNQTHYGPFGIYRPNVTIMTHPDDFLRATIRCHDIGNRACIVAGDGFYDGAAEVKLLNVNIVMTTSNINAKTSGTCIQFNEGQGSGVTPYWQFYINAASRQNVSENTGTSVIRDVDISGCTLHAIKLSTFITNVLIEKNTIHDISGTAIELRNANNVSIRYNRIERVSDGSGIVVGGGSRHVLIENNYIKNINDRGILVGSDNTEVQYMDVDYITTEGLNRFYDAIHVRVWNNIIVEIGNAGIAFYSAYNVTTMHNTLYNVGKQGQAGILFNLSPKVLNATYDILSPNENITVINNLVVLSSQLPNLPMVEARIMSSSKRNINLPDVFPVANASLCEATSATTSTRRFLRSQQQPTHTKQDRSLADTATLRNSDGSCQLFPQDNPWYDDIHDLPVHPNSEAIKLLIGIGSSVHPDFGGGMTVNKKRVLYGIPITTVNTLQNTISDQSKYTTPQPFVPIDIDPVTGYPDECDYPLLYPFPTDSVVEGSYLNCPDNLCGGDRHVLVIDNSTCTLYETWRTFPPNITASKRWVADIAVKFNLNNNDRRPIGWTSSDAAGLAVVPGLIKFDEVINKGAINHAIRFTGPNSRAAYSSPASHYAPFGNAGPDSPWMGMRIRLKANFDCTSLKRVARIFCETMKVYGGIFADNGSPWYFSGEATEQWTPYLSEISDMKKIPATAFEVVDSGCLCLDAECTITECSNGLVNDPYAPSVHSSIADYSTITIEDNIFRRLDGKSGRFVDRRTGYLGQGFDGTLSTWQQYIKTTQNNMEVDPKINIETYQLSLDSPGKYAVPLHPAIQNDFFGNPIDVNDGKVDIGVLLPTIVVNTMTPSTPRTIRPSAEPSKRPTMSPSKLPSQQPTMSPTIKTLSITFQSGRSIKKINNNNAVEYQANFDSSISTQYLDTYNNNNGMTTFYGTSKTTLTTGFNSNAEFRYLIKFLQLNQFIDIVKMNIISVELLLQVTNWQSSSTQLQVCVLNKPWDHMKYVNYQGTGWRYNAYDTQTKKSTSWKETGGWGNCIDGSVTTSTAISAQGNTPVRISLSKQDVSKWITSPGSNHGLLIRVRGTSNSAVNIAVTTNKDVTKRPALVFTYTSK